MSQLLDVSQIHVRFVEDGTDGLIAWASCVVGNTIKLDNIAIRRSRDGQLYTTYPAKLTSGGKKYNYYNPVNVTAAKAIQEAVLAHFAWHQSDPVNVNAEDARAQ